MPAALPHTNRIAQGFTKDVEFATREVQFGNGYKEIAVKGINDKTEMWTLPYQALNDDEYDDLIDVLDAVKKHDYVTWTPFGESSSKSWYVVGPRSETYSDGFWDVIIKLETYR